MALESSAEYNVNGYIWFHRQFARPSPFEIYIWYDITLETMSGSSNHIWKHIKLIQAEKFIIRRTRDMRECLYS